ncbi:helix-turn-helix domain-containing protein [Pedobacter rhizosphaerae]|uniref:Helix-turn-helix n=1 Tax=Pedobacter rhizosphaerae TaxID=390241 RepID=A0A1H9KRN1_9SPHI|nr:helix-turn-helix domain-containing protein [Pedobacter rhizosphaerae]SER01810.1 Helix-turn-helix [Pedobacter rhizosphaerae]
MNIIKKESDYNAVMAKIDSLMSKGSHNVSKEELAEIRTLALTAQAYEQEKYTVPPPDTLVGMIEMKMYEMKLKQKDLAEKLNVSTAKLSLIMNGKQKADVEFLKSVYTQLNVDAEFILQHA